MNSHFSGGQKGLTCLNRKHLQTTNSNVSKIVICHKMVLIHDFATVFNLLTHMAILGSSHAGANKDMMTKIWTNGDTVI